MMNLMKFNLMTNLMQFNLIVNLMESNEEFNDLMKFNFDDEFDYFI